MKKVDFKQAKIYRIEVMNDATAPMYIGSTTKKYLSQRLSGHRSQFQRWKQGNRRSVSTSYKLFDEYGVDNCNIVLIEDYPCDNVNALRAREGFHIRNTPNCVNRYIAGRSKKEWRRTNEKYLEYSREYSRAHSHEYYMANKEEILKRRSTKHDCECGGRYTNRHRLVHLRSKLHQNFVTELQR